jgi:hypothetical protein
VLPVGGALLRRAIVARAAEGLPMPAQVHSTSSFLLTLARSNAVAPIAGGAGVRRRQHRPAAAARAGRRLDGRGLRGAARRRARLSADGRHLHRLTLEIVGR